MSFPPSSLAYQLLLSLCWVLSRQPYCWDFPGGVSRTHIEDSILQQIPWSSTFYHRSTPLPWGLLCLRYEDCTIDVSIGHPRQLFAAFWPVVQFRNDLHLRQKKLFFSSALRSPGLWCSLWEPWHSLLSSLPSASPNRCQQCLEQASDAAQPPPTTREGAANITRPSFQESRKSVFIGEMFCL